MPDTQLELLAGERQKGETDKAVQACNDWLRLGPGRTLPSLLSQYGETKRPKAPTASMSTLQIWSMKFSWAERARAYDATWEARKNAEREAVFQQGLALDYERVRDLIQLATLLKQQIYELEEGKLINLWLEDVKGIGGQDNFERVDIERFNAALLEQYRRTLDDIAKEVGDRRQKTDIDIPSGLRLRIDDMASLLKAVQQHKDGERGSGA